MSIYTSQGTIRIRCGAGASETTIYFVPEKDYSIKHGNKNYAVFVPQSCGCSGQSCKNTIIRKYNPDEGKEIEMHAAGTDCMNVISTAAANRVKVQVEVKATLKEEAERILEAMKNVDEEADTKNDVQAVKNAVNKLISTVKNESKQCLKLVGITIPAQ